MFPETGSNPKHASLLAPLHQKLTTKSMQSLYRFQITTICTDRYCIDHEYTPQGDRENIITVTRHTRDHTFLLLMIFPDFLLTIKSV